MFMLCWWEAAASIDTTARRHHNARFCLRAVCAAFQGSTLVGAILCRLEALVRATPRLLCCQLGPALHGPCVVDSGPAFPWLCLLAGAGGWWCAAVHHLTGGAGALQRAGHRCGAPASAATVCPSHKPTNQSLAVPACT